jgi:hypothetical protein
MTQSGSRTVGKQAVEGTAAGAFGKRSRGTPVRLCPEAAEAQRPRHHAIPRPPRKPFDQRLWDDLVAMQIDPPGATLTFVHRLCQEHGWNRETAETVALEYRRFLYLAVRAGHPVTPSGYVDKAWHLHLVYTRHYWDVMCGQILRTPLHHEPSQGGGMETARFDDQYQRTLESYAAHFGQVAPKAVWPHPVLSSPQARSPKSGVTQSTGAAICWAHAPQDSDTALGDAGTGGGANCAGASCGGGGCVGGCGGG